MTILEIKRHLDGREERFRCEALLIQPGQQALVRFATDRPYREGPIDLPPGPKVTLGVFWQDRSYLVYRFLMDGKLQGHRFDVCEGVSITPERIVYTDLVLDFWVDPQNRLHALDEEEFQHCRAQGLLRPDQVALVARARRELQAGYLEVVREVEALVSAVAAS